MPALVARQRVGDVALLGPALGRPVAMLGDADDVHEAAGRDPVVHDVAVRPHPVVRGDLDAEMRDALGRHQAAPGDAAGEARLLRPEHDVAHACCGCRRRRPAGRPRPSRRSRSARRRARPSARGRPACGRHARARPAAPPPAGWRGRRDGSGSTARRTSPRPRGRRGARCRVRPSSQRRWCTACGRTPAASSAGLRPRRISSREALGLIWMPAPISVMRGACS